MNKYPGVNDKDVIPSSPRMIKENSYVVEDKECSTFFEVLISIFAFIPIILSLTLGYKVSIKVTNDKK